MTSPPQTPQLGGRGSSILLLSLIGNTNIIPIMLSYHWNWFWGKGQNHEVGSGIRDEEWSSIGDAVVGYAITVEFTLRPGAMTAFRKLVDENAKNSFDLESGCQRFDVLVPFNSKDKISLYEIYDDKAAFEVHLKTEHFLNFNRDSSDLVVNKSIVAFDLAYEASRQKD
jgi:(4S)-4-hydroxy-5-phosphonooxypentane-2,3-dione isomerase